jgi:hypothetical protein
MTITINIPTNAESKLQQEAARTGVPMQTLIEHIVSEKFDNPMSGRESSRQFLTGSRDPGRP